MQPGYSSQNFHFDTCTFFANEIVYPCGIHQKFVALSSYGGLGFIKYHINHIHLLYMFCYPAVAGYHAMTAMLLCLFCYERDFIMSLSDDTQADIIEDFNSTSRYLDNLLNINNPYFEGMVSQIYPTEL